MKKDKHFHMTAKELDALEVREQHIFSEEYNARKTEMLNSLSAKPIRTENKDMAKAGEDNGQLKQEKAGRTRGMLLTEFIIGGVAALLLAGILWGVLRNHEEDRSEPSSVSDGIDHTEDISGSQELTTDTKEMTVTTETNADWSQTGVYPITPEDPEWKELSYQTLIVRLNMPDDILEKQSMEQLTVWFANYPYLIDIYAFDRVEYGFASLMSKSNICKKFLCQPDAGHYIIEYLEQALERGADDGNIMIGVLMSCLSWKYDKLNDSDKERYEKLEEALKAQIP